MAAALDGARAVSVTLAREAMVAEPATLAASATATEAGDRLAQPDVRAVLVTDGDGRLVGVVTRTTLVREVVAAGRDPRETPLGEIAEAATLHGRCRPARRRGVPAAGGRRPRARARRRGRAGSSASSRAASSSAVWRRTSRRSCPPRRLRPGAHAREHPVVASRAVVEALEPPGRAGFGVRVVERRARRRRSSP